MQNALLSASFILLLAGSVSAYSLDFTVLDYLTFNPIASANVTILNVTTVYDTGLTDTDGNIALSATTGGVNTVLTQKLGYNDRSESITVTTDASRIIYLTSNTAESIIRLSFNDLTGVGRDREFCLNFETNNRLVDCYYVNETVRIIVDTNYTIKPKLQPSDLLGIEQLGVVGRHYSEKIAGSMLIILFILGVGYAVVKYR